MAGKMRLAAIFVTLSALLATAGGTVYYYMASGATLPQMLGLAGTESNDAGKDPAAAAGEGHGTDFSTAALAAVERAWAGAASTSDAARDPHGVALAGQESAPTDRYGRYAGVPTPLAAAATPADPPTHGSAAAEPRDRPAAEADPIPLIAEPAGLVAQPDPPGVPVHAVTAAGSGYDDPLPWDDERPTDLARGQQPSDEPDPLEPDQFEPADQVEPAEARGEPAESESSASSIRAREAFRDRSPEAAGRYANAAGPENVHHPFDSHPGPTQPMPVELDDLPDDLDQLPDYQPAEDPIRPDADFHPAAEVPSPIEPPASDFQESASPEGTGRPGERALEGPQQPALVIHKTAPSEIQVGKPAKFLVKVQNVGSQSADEVVLRDEVPQRTQLIGTTPAAEVAGSQLVWNIGRLSTGEERTVEVELMPVAEGDVGSVATVSYSSHASVRTRCTMPQLAIRMTAPERVMIGHELRVNIELHNPGSGDATGVMLFENVPDNLRHEAGTALEFEVGTLPAGQTRELELILVAEKPGHVVNVLTARADGNLQVEQQVEIEVIAPDLAIAIDGPGRRYLERPATYQVTIENPGSAPARDVELVTRLPQGLRFIRANNMGEYDAGTHAIYWSLAELPEGERGMVELVAMPVETGPQTLEAEGKAQQGLADRTKREIVIDGLAAIMFELRDTDDPIEVGGETTYEIRVVNQGTAAATNVAVRVTLPPAMQLVSAEGQTRHAPAGGAIVFEPLDKLPPKTDALYHVRAKGLQPGDQRVLVEVQTDELSQPIRSEESTRIFGDD